jgi:hypothetical protein
MVDTLPATLLILIKFCVSWPAAFQSSRNRASREVSNFEFLAGAAQDCKALLEEIGEERGAEKIVGGTSVVRSCRLRADGGPIACRIIIPPQPGQRHEIDLLIFRQRVDERCKLLDHGVIAVVLEDRRVSVIGTSSLASNSRALMMTKQTFSVEIVRVSVATTSDRVALVLMRFHRFLDLTQPPVA